MLFRSEIPLEPVLEMTVPSVADPSAAPSGAHLLSVRVPFLPREIDWPGHVALLQRRVISTVAAYAPGLRERIVDVRVVAPDEFSARLGDLAPCRSTRLLASYAGRIRTGVEGLYLCGKCAEPVLMPSGRAARIAAAMALSAAAKAESAA